MVKTQYHETIFGSPSYRFELTENDKSTLIGVFPYYDLIEIDDALFYCDPFDPLFDLVRDLTIENKLEIPDLVLYEGYNMPFSNQDFFYGTDDPYRVIYSKEEDMIEDIYALLGVPLDSDLSIRRLFETNGITLHVNNEISYQGVTNKLIFTGEHYLFVSKTGQP